MSKKIAENYLRLIASIENCAKAAGRKPEEITLVAVTKNQTIEDVMSLYDVGCRVFGESRLQESESKIAAMPQDCVWHLIGTLQKNKVRKAVEHFSVIESVDTFSLAEKISAVSVEQGKRVPVLLQVNTSGEISKHGLSPEDWKKVVVDLLQLPGIQLEGLMTMAPLTHDRLLIRQCFVRLKSLRDQLPGIGPELSMGMSQDYREAIAEGATLLRVGSLLFS